MYVVCACISLQCVNANYYTANLGSPPQYIVFRLVYSNSTLTIHNNWVPYVRYHQSVIGVSDLLVAVSRGVGST